MLISLINNLRGITILTNKNILDLRWFISNRYPDIPQKEAAKIFADSINRIINQNLSMVSENVRPQLKTIIFSLQKLFRKH
jgi:hypothetical protein